MNLGELDMGTKLEYFLDMAYLLLLDVSILEGQPLPQLKGNVKKL